MTQRTWNADWAIIAMAFAVMSVEGYDLGILGSLLPILLNDPSLGLGTGQAGLVGSAGFVGMLVGGVLVGRLSGRLGLAVVLRAGIGVFSLAMLLSAAAPGVPLLGLGRLIAGIGLGVVMPGCMSITRSRCDVATSPLAISVVMAGIPMGGMTASLVSYLWAVQTGWRILFALGAFLGAAIFPMAMAMVRRSTHIDSSPAQALSTKQLPLTQVIRPVIAGAIATFCFLLSFYGLITWTTKLMTTLAIPLQGAFQLSMIMNLGAVIGSVVVGIAATRYGALRLTLICAAGCVIFLVLVPSGLASGGWLLLLVGALGMASPSTQNLVNSLVVNSVRGEQRTAVLGLTLGIGRMGAVAAPVIGSTLLTIVPPGDGLTSPAATVFIAFALSCAIGGVAAVVLARTPSPGQRDTVIDESAEPDPQPTASRR